jgi:thiamine monophosphate synthase
VRIEDAFIYVALEFDGVSLENGFELCSEAIGGGADVIELDLSAAAGSVGLEHAVSIVEVCRREESLCLVKDDPGLAAIIGAHGVRLDGYDQGIGLARALAGGGLVGMSSRNSDEAVLSLEVGADFLVHMAGSECARDFAGLGSEAAVPLFAAGLAGLEDAESVVRRGIYRLCIEGRILRKKGVKEQISQYSRLIGRIM